MPKAPLKAPEGRQFFRDGLFFHSQIRVGKGGKPFAMRKFRTMERGTHRTYAGSGSFHKDPFESAAPGKPTRIGGLLRKTKLDELPQLWDFLRRRLNLAGWRPVTRQEYRHLPEDIRRLYNENGPAVAGIYYALPKKERTAEKSYTGCTGSSARNWKGASTGHTQSTYRE